MLPSRLWPDEIYLGPDSDLVENGINRVIVLTGAAAMPDSPVYFHKQVVDRRVAEAEAPLKAQIDELQAKLDIVVRDASAALKDAKLPAVAPPAGKVGAAVPSDMAAPKGK